MQGRWQYAFRESTPYSFLYAVTVIMQLTVVPQRYQESAFSPETKNLK